MIRTQLVNPLDERAVICGRDCIGRKYVRILPMTSAEYLKRQVRSEHEGIGAAFDSLDRFDREFLSTGAVPDLYLVADSFTDQAMRDRVLNKISCFFSLHQYALLLAGITTISEIAKSNRAAIQARFDDESFAPCGTVVQ